MRRLGLLVLLGLAGCVLDTQTVSAVPDGNGPWAPGDDGAIFYKDGNVGIGTGVPRATLEVNDGSAVIGKWGATTPSDLEQRTLLLGPRPDSAGLVTFGLQVNATEKGTIQYDAVNGLSFGTFDDAWVTRMTINKNGNVGIGTSTPKHVLEVVDAEPVLAIHGNMNDAQFHSNRISFQNSAGGENSYIRATYLVGGNDLELGTQAGGSVYFSTIPVAGAGAERMRIDPNGNVGIGTSLPTERLHVEGNILATGTIKGSNFPDLAENITTSEPFVEAADIVSSAPSDAERVVRSSRPYDPTVLGVISTQPGILLNSGPSAVETDLARERLQRPLALAGRVPVKITLEGGPVRPGDPLTTSSVPGHAMRANEPWRGGIIGTALTGFDGKDEQGRAAATGKVIVFLALDRTASCNPETQDRLASRVGELEGKLAAEREARAELEARLRALEAAFARPSGTARPSTAAVAPTR